MNGKKICFYIIGSSIVLLVACMIVPKLSKKITNKIYKAKISRGNHDDEWGPEIVHKTQRK